MKNFKKILATVGMFGVAVPASLTVVACGGQTATNYGVNADAVTALSKIINDQVGKDITGLISNQWSYNKLFGLKGETNDGVWEILIFNPLKASLEALTDKDGDKDVRRYSDEQIAEQLTNVSKYLKDGLNLIYVSAPLEGEDIKQEIIHTYVVDETKDNLLWQLYGEEQDKEKDQDGNPTRTAQSLGFTFKNAGNINLKDDANEKFWVFSFIE